MLTSSRSLSFPNSWLSQRIVNILVLITLKINIVKHFSDVLLRFDEHDVLLVEVEGVDGDHREVVVG